MANLFAKTRKADHPYFIVQYEGWEWKVLKLYQMPKNAIANERSRAFCAVSSPLTYGSYDLGDVYCHEIPGMINALTGMVGTA